MNCRAITLCLLVALFGGSALASWTAWRAAYQIYKPFKGLVHQKTCNAPGKGEEQCKGSHTSSTSSRLALVAKGSQVETRGLSMQPVGPRQGVLLSRPSRKEAEDALATTGAAQEEQAATSSEADQDYDHLFKGMWVPSLLLLVPLLFVQCGDSNAACSYCRGRFWRRPVKPLSALHRG